ncbi:hypothetical protein [Paenibacillus azoreducens]|uniref:Uncharacterized protein n=1 Tax=Paenibacillus azoreducens TaxID=116718 RepID=A0A919YEC2_9BACL|nr:hypothetical protein [Paenibacillus azoreducens]GIO49111.1 hypothetical protein J34TS1_38760 [Paenibacillus azoreducens]
MHIDRSKWFNGADSPVLFMIDDLANAWVDTSGDGSLDWGEDWGFFKEEDRSSFRFLREEILKYYPEVKVTFFVPVGARVGMIQNPVHAMTAQPINADEDSKAFFRSVHQHPNYELAYHGTTHGIVGEEAKDFIQEWASFASLEEALHQIDEGVRIFEDAVGMKPSGGKYCGYTSNGFSDQSIDESGFAWWCRYWNRGRADGSEDPCCGPDSDPLSNYDVKRFGQNGVLDIPSTVNGALLNGLYHARTSAKDRIKRMLKPVFIKWKLREIDYLLKHRLVISVQEHIAPSRDDGRRQSPNIFDDRESLLQIFSYVKGKNVWYCTGTELADYVNLRDRVMIERFAENRFALKHETKDRDKLLSLSFSELRPFRLQLPDGRHLDVRKGAANVPVMEGDYVITRGI